MANVRLTIEYNGAGFHGWQKQLGVRTIEEVLHATLETVLREKIAKITASGRTDAGVHAHAQVVSFHCAAPPDLDRLRRSVSSILRGELSILTAEIVPDEFHARYDATSKQYLYTILNRDTPAVLDRGRVWLITRPLDIARMQKEAAYLVGTHDFKSFQGATCEAPETVKKLFTSEVISEPPYIYYRVVGSGFLKQMVRNIVGTLVQFGKGMNDYPSMVEILAARDRRQAGPTAPAHGLCLEWVKY